jgi:hypothetical protein
VTAPLPPAVPWLLWAPPIDPPTDGGLPAKTAQAIADAVWQDDPHECAALQWEAYAGMLPPTPAVSNVSTGSQSVAYSPAAPTGDYGLAIQRAAWHRSFVAGKLESIPLVIAPTAAGPGIGPWWGVDAPVDDDTPIVQPIE